MSKILSEIERQSIEQRIAKIENDTRAEIVIAIKERSGRYQRWALIGGLVGAGVLAVVSHSALSQGGTATVDPLRVASVAAVGGLLISIFCLVPPIQALLLPRGVRERAVRDAAAQQFDKYGVGRTKERTGVFLYLSIFERFCVVLADDGLDLLVSEGFWEAQAQVLREGLEQRKAAVAIHKVLSAVGELLHARLPVGKGPVNELSNRIET